MAHGITLNEKILVKDLYQHTYTYKKEIQTYFVKNGYEGAIFKDSSHKVRKIIDSKAPLKVIDSYEYRASAVAENLYRYHKKDTYTFQEIKEIFPNLSDEIISMTEKIYKEKILKDRYVDYDERDTQKNLRISHITDLSEEDLDLDEKGKSKRFPNLERIYIIDDDDDARYALGGKNATRACSYSPNEYVLCLRKIHEIIKDIELPLDTEKKQLEAFKRIATYITSIPYDSYGLDVGKYDLKRDNDAYCMIGILLDGTAVCAGYAKTLKEMLNFIGIECKQIGGNEEVKDKNTGKDVAGGGHAWNQVKIGENWYNVDLCWDRNEEGQNLSCEELLHSDNDFSIDGHNKYTLSRNYQIEKSCLMSYRESVTDRIASINLDQLDQSFAANSHNFIER